MIDCEEILISCGSLVRLSADDDRIESAHFTVAEYLRDIDPNIQPLLARFRISDDLMNRCMAETCLTALTFDNITGDAMRDPASLIQFLRQSPFYWHAARSWDGYARNCCRRASIVALTKRLFLGPNPWHYRVWAHAYLLYWNNGLFCNVLPRHISMTSMDASGMNRTDRTESFASYKSLSEWSWALTTAAKWGKLRFASLLHQDHLLGDLFQSIEELNDAGSIGTPLHFALLGQRILTLRPVSLATFEHWSFRTEQVACPLTAKTVKTLLDIGADMNVKYPLRDGTATSTALIVYATDHLEVAIESELPLDRDTANWLYDNGTEKALASIRSVDIGRIAEIDRPSVIRLLRKLKRSSKTVNSQVTADPTSFFDERNKLLSGYGDLLHETCNNNDLPTVQWFFENSRIPFDDALDRGKTILHMACRYQSVSIVKYLMEKRAKVDKMDSKGKTPLGCLLKIGSNFSLSRLTIMESLLKAGAKAYAIDGDSNSCLHCWAHMSCSREQVSQLQKLLNTIVMFQSDLSRTNDAGETVWHILAANPDGHRLSEMLIAANRQDDARSTVNVANKEGWTPLHVATLKHNENMMQMLMNLGSSVAKKTSDGQTVLDLAFKVMSISNIPLNIALGVERHKIDEGGSRLVTRHTIPDQIMAMIRKGDLIGLKNFAAAGGNFELCFKSCTCMPVTVALMKSQVAIVKYLQSFKITLGTIVCRSHHPLGFSALGALASQSLMFEPLREALASSENVTVQDFEHMIHAAAANENLRALHFLLVEMGHMQILKSGRRRNVPVYRFRRSRRPHMIWIDGTALHTAVRSGKRKSVQKLLEQGFNPDVLDSKGVPCSHLAAQRGDSRTLELLLSHGGTVDVRNAAMLTTLGLVVSTDHVNIVRLMLEHGADLSARDHRGYSLLRLASLGGKPSIYFLLVEAGLKLTLEDIVAWYDAGFRQICMAKDYMEQLMVVPDFLMPKKSPKARAVVNLVPPHLRRLNLTCRCRAMDVRVTALYLAATLGRLDSIKVLLGAGAMLNLEGGMEGTPLMGACRTGRLEIVKYLVRNGAVLNYTKRGVHFNAFNKAASYPKIQCWFLVERFTEQRMIAAGELFGEERTDVAVTVEGEEEDTCTYTDEIADVTLDLVLKDDLEQYLESKNWFLPMRRFVDDGKGAFERVPIMPEEFAKYRPLGFKVSPG